MNYGQDINALPGDLIGKPPGSAPTRLNPSFGPIGYTQNDRYSNYEGVTFNVRGRFRRAFFDASYTRSVSKDDAGLYPTAINPGQFYNNSPWDVPNRFSLTANYELPGLNQGPGLRGQGYRRLGRERHQHRPERLSVYCVHQRLVHWRRRLQR